MMDTSGWRAGTVGDDVADDAGDDAEEDDVVAEDDVVEIMVPSVSGRSVGWFDGG
ncbi:hypothetical protein [Bifidobacterium margollesii]|uniref:hypothetical protein n=1 Tax=Bifidobacterium margollesii TaxID=2020964 RepID=UPI0013FD8EF2|nr:hypothetical protein [Bifidobacterium margollesii]